MAVRLEGYERREQGQVLERERPSLKELQHLDGFSWNDRIAATNRLDLTPDSPEEPLNTGRVRPTRALGLVVAGTPDSEDDARWTKPSIVHSHYVDTPEEHVDSWPVETPDNERSWSEQEQNFQRTPDQKRMWAETPDDERGFDEDAFLREEYISKAVSPDDRRSPKVLLNGKVIRSARNSNRNGSSSDEDLENPPSSSWSWRRRRFLSVEDAISSEGDRTPDSPSDEDLFLPRRRHVSNSVLSRSPGALEAGLEDEYTTRSIEKGSHRRKRGTGRKNSVGAERRDPVSLGEDLGTQGEDQATSVEEERTPEEEITLDGNDTQRRDQILDVLRNHGFEAESRLVDINVGTKRWSVNNYISLPAEYHVCFREWVNFHCTTGAEMEEVLSCPMNRNPAHVAEKNAFTVPSTSSDEEEAAAGDKHITSAIDLLKSRATVAEFLHTNADKDMYYSFCHGRLTSSDELSHCIGCHWCLDRNYVHCNRCDSCVYGHRVSRCEHCHGSQSED
ncbi:Hypp464 [Branchiostoma lanceolatum]|uniref:Hypp464 protein n=1 Tax=Branchiostoma lanceolatum TaxID=7740 RepID=A0A8J9VE86_BRALA|nr:Hypp464 [Branchiostoma lanceolatum]